MKNLRIAVAVPVFPNIVQTYILSTLNAFKIMRLDFRVIAEVKKDYDQLPCSVTDNKLQEHAIYINASFRNIIHELISLPVLSPTYWKLAASVLTDTRHSVSLSYRIKSALRSRLLVLYPLDVMHSHSLFISHHYLFIKDIFNIPIITTYHGQVPKGVKKLSATKQNDVLSKVDRFIVNTEFAKNELTQLGCDVGKIKMIPQGTDLDAFKFNAHAIPPSKKIKILTVGRLSLEKGHEVAIRALASIKKRITGIEYHIVGHGPELDRLSTLATDLGVQEMVIFHGFKTGDELKQLFACSHIFVLPSINTGDGYLIETQGVVLQEAQATGLPVIGSTTGGIPDVIDDEETGLLFEESNHTDLANKIMQLINDEVFYEKLSLAGRRDVETNYDIKVVSERLHTLYQEVVSQA